MRRVLTIPISRSAVAVAALSVLAAAGGRLSAQRSAPPAGYPGALDAYIAKAVADWEVPGLAIAVVRNDSVLVAKGYGVRELGKPERVDENTVFSIASLTKSFTATAAAMLVDDGKLEWDAPARRYLPGLAFRDPYLTENVTVRDLLSHRTGLHASNMAWQLTGVTGADRAEMIRRARYLEAEALFRTRLVYSNLGYLFAGEAIAAAAGMPYEEVVRQRIIGPLGLRSTTIGDAAAARAPNRAMPHAMINGVQRPIPWRDIDVIAAAGSVNSTAADMAQWLRFQLGDGTFAGRRLVSAGAFWEIHSPQLVIPVSQGMKSARMVEGWAAYGMGWQVMDYRGHPLVWHTGNADGMPAYMAILPQDHLGVVIMVNTWSAGLIHALLMNRVLDEYLGYPPRDWSGEALPRKAEIRAGYDYTRNAQRLSAGRVSGTAPSHPLAAYAGVYADSLYGTQTVALANGRLTLRMGKGQVADLSHWHYDTFLVTWRDPLFREVFPALLTFSSDYAGRVDRLTLPINRDVIRSVREAP
jgi:CubicO group peptidase (beta-lactamase class C family)